MVSLSRRPSLAQSLWHSLSRSSAVAAAAHDAAHRPQTGTDVGTDAVIAAESAKRADARYDTAVRALASAAQDAETAIDVDEGVAADSDAVTTAATTVEAPVYLVRSRSSDRPHSSSSSAHESTEAADTLELACAPTTAPAPLPLANPLFKCPEPVVGHVHVHSTGDSTSSGTHAPSQAQTHPQALAQSQIPEQGQTPAQRTAKPQLPPLPPLHAHPNLREIENEAVQKSQQLKLEQEQTQRTGHGKPRAYVRAALAERGGVARPSTGVTSSKSAASMFGLLPLPSPSPRRAPSAPPLHLTTSTPASVIATRAVPANSSLAEADADVAAEAEEDADVAAAAGGLQALMRAPPRSPLAREGRMRQLLRAHWTVRPAAQSPRLIESEAEMDIDAESGVGVTKRVDLDPVAHLGMPPPPGHAARGLKSTSKESHESEVDQTTE